MKTLIKLNCFLILIFCIQISFSQNNLPSDDVTVGLHKVEQGETLYSISKRFFLSVSDVTEVNIGLTAENLKAGQIIKIPITVRNKELFNEKEPQLTAVSNNTFPAKKKHTRKVDKSTKINIAVLLPLNYEEVDKLTFTKFNIDEKKRLKYKCFEYINFYEGMRIALDVLEKEGYKVDCYVYDVGENDINKMQQALQAKEMEDMDLIIPLVFKQPFSIAAEFARNNEIPIVNPMSTDLSILDNNYVFKIQPSQAAEVETVVRLLRKNFSQSKVIVLYDNNPQIQSMVKYYELLLSKGTAPYVLMDYNKYSARITNQLSSSNGNVVINLVDKGNIRENESYAKRLCKIFSSKPEANIVLFADYTWMEFPTFDLTLLDKYRFHFVLSYLNDYSNPDFVNFVKIFREHFKTEPDKIYAALGYDIMIYFVRSLIENGEDFMSEPNMDDTKTMISPFRFERQDETKGYQNKMTTIYAIENYKIKSIGR